MTLVLTPQTAPLNTIVRSDSSAVNMNFKYLLPNPVEKRNLFVDAPKWSTPTSFEGRRVWKTYLSRVKNQSSCGGCYAFATTSALADCFNLRSLGKLHLNLSAARIILCDLLGQYSILLLPRQISSEYVSNVFTQYGCAGNTLMESWMFLFTFGTNTEECFPESTINRKTNCQQVSSKNYDTCIDKEPAVFWRAQHVYAVAGIPEDGGNEERIRQIIYKFGPVSTAMTIYEDFYTFDTSKIYVYDKYSRRLNGHAVVIDGWGEDDGVPYWWVRNSWGSKWGNNGYFRILRGSNHCQIEENVIAGLPDIINVNSPYFDQTLFQDYMANELSRRAVISPYTPAGGIDYKTGISRRQLSYEKNARQKVKLKVNYDPRLFFAGKLGSSSRFLQLSWILLAVLLCIIITLLSN